MNDREKGFAALLAELKRRRVYRAGAMHVMASFVLWQAAEIAVPALGLRDAVLTVVVVGSIVLFPVTLIGAWLYDIRLDREREGLPPALREWLSESRTRVVGVVGIAALIIGLGVTLVVRSAGRDAGGVRVGDDTRVAVFPLSTVALDDDARYGEGIAELLNVGLDGIPGLEILDPSAFWPPLLTAGILPSLRSDPTGYLETSRRFQVAKYVTGTVVLAGASADVSVRIHDGRSGDELGALRASAAIDSLSALVDELIVGLVVELWEGERIPEIPSIERFATSDPQALQGYLEAMRLLRRGDFVGAEREIERALVADSTFALAHLAHFRIRSWRLFSDGRPMTGVQEIVRRADRYKDRLSRRGRLSVEAAVALDDTRGADAAVLIEQILDIDPDDVAARARHAVAVGRYGWQFGRDRDDARSAYDRALALDSLDLTLLVSRAGIAMRDGDFELAEGLVRKMERVHPDSELTVGERLGLELITAGEDDVDAVIDRSLDGSISEAIRAYRRARNVAPERALRMGYRLMAEAPSVRHRSLGRGSVFQVSLAAGRLSAVDSLLSRRRDGDDRRPAMLRALVAADLIGAGDRALAGAAVAELTALAPSDSLVAYLESRPEIWAAAWAVGAWHAVQGDTAIARAYRDGIRAMPAGGIPEEWPEALAADIESRLARRRGDATEALEWSRVAYALWTIHTPQASEWYPEPAIRFHRAELLDESGESEVATALYQSFVHMTWVGFYTPHAALRLGRHLEDAGDVEGARFAYTRAVRLWELGDQDVVSPLLEEAKARLSGG